jgi:hypothetical protein
MTVKVKFKNGVFHPIDKIDKKIKENDVFELDISNKKRFVWRGALKGKKETSVELQHKVKEMW